MNGYYIHFFYHFKGGITSWLKEKRNMSKPSKTKAVVRAAASQIWERIRDNLDNLERAETSTSNLETINFPLKIRKRPTISKDGYMSTVIMSDQRTQTDPLISGTMENSDSGGQLPSTSEKVSMEISDCGICLGPFTSQNELVVLHCGHCLCAKCCKTLQDQDNPINGQIKMYNSFFKCPLCRTNLKKDSHVTCKFRSVEAFTESERKTFSKILDGFRYDVVAKLIANTKDMLMVESERQKFFLIPKYSGKKTLERNRPDIVAKLSSNEAYPLLKKNLKMLKVLDKSLLKTLNSLKKAPAYVSHDLSTHIARCMVRILKAKTLNLHGTPHDWWPNLL